MIGGGGCAVFSLLCDMLSDACGAVKLVAIVRDPCRAPSLPTSDFVLTCLLIRLWLWHGRITTLFLYTCSSSAMLHPLHQCCERCRVIFRSQSLLLCPMRHSPRKTSLCYLVRTQLRGPSINFPFRCYFYSLVHFKTKITIRLFGAFGQMLESDKLPYSQHLKENVQLVRAATHVRAGYVLPSSQTVIYHIDSQGTACIGRVRCLVAGPGGL